MKIDMKYVLDTQERLDLIKDRALDLHDQLCDLDEECEWYHGSSFYVETNMVDMLINVNNIDLSYTDWDGYGHSQVIRIKWLDMEVEDIRQLLLDEEIKRMSREFEDFEKQADNLGYTLVKKLEG